MAVAVTAASATAAVQAGPTVMQVKLSNVGITTTPQSVLAGKIVFRVTNTSRAPRDFEVDGKKTPTLATGKTATLTGTFAAHP
jgi:hypothetical protein